MKLPIAPARIASVMSQPQAWQTWRIADGRFDPFKPDGASLVGGRWNSPGLGVICASRLYAGAMLECLVHAGTGRVPSTHVAVEIAIAATVTEGYEQSDLCAADDGVVQVDGHGFQSFDTLAIVIGCQYRRTLFIDGATRNIPAEVTSTLVTWPARVVKKSVFVKRLPSFIKHS